MLRVARRRSTLSLPPAAGLESLCHSREAGIQLLFNEWRQRLGLCRKRVQGFFINDAGPAAKRKCFAPNVVKTLIPQWYTFKIAPLSAIDHVVRNPAQ